MKTLFAIIGSTRDQLRQQQLLLQITRRHPQQGGRLRDWLNAVIEGKLPTSSYLPHHEIRGAKVLRQYPEIENNREDRDVDRGQDVPSHIRGPPRAVSIVRSPS